MNLKGLLKPGLLELRAYSLSPERGSVKLNQNESPWDVPEAIRRETLRRMEGRAWSRYGDFTPLALREKLAAFAGWTSEGVVAGNGSNELIQATLMAAIGEGRRVLITEPTFALYRQLAVILGGEVVSVPLREDLSFDTGALLDAVERERPEVVVLCSPNNPTGCRIERSELSALLEAARGLVVLDEAYFEFAGESLASLLEEHENLVVFRTFSKALAMAALRIGYLLAAPALAREISKAVLPYNINLFSQTAAMVAVEMYEAELLPRVGRIVEERERVRGELCRIEGAEPLASHANFMLVRTALNPTRVYRELLERHDVLVRDVSAYPMLKEFIRVSVGTREENDRLLEGLREIHAGVGSHDELSLENGAARSLN